MTEFPAFTKLEHQPGNAAQSLLAELNSALEPAERRFADFSREAQRQMSTALSAPRINGSLNLDVAGMREAARAAEDQARIAREVATATELAASRAGDFSQNARLAIAATEALARESEEAAAKARQHADAVAQVQAELNLFTSRARVVTGDFLALAQAEAGAADGAKMLEGIYRNTALEAGRVANSARESARVFEELFAQEARQEAATQQLAAEYGRLAEAEAGAATGARLLGAIYAGTAAEIGRVTNSARESASAFELMFQAQDARTSTAAQAFFNSALGIDAQTKSARESARAFEEMFAAQEQAARAQTEAAAGAAQLRAQLDPMFAAQQRFDNELAKADDLLRAGAITSREYAAAQQLARDNLRQSAEAVMQLGQVQERVARRGTDAYGAVTNSVRANRVAFVQLGQQMQDVVVQAQMGTNAFQIFAQQVPQAAFALSGLEGKAGSAAARIGAFATFLSGPWGAAIFAATAVLGPFVYSLFQADEAAKDVTLSTSAFGEVQSALSNVLDLTTGRITAQTDAMWGLARAQMEVIRAEALRTQSEARSAMADQSRGSRDFSFLNALTVGSLGDRAGEEFGQSRAPAETIVSRFMSGQLGSTAAIDNLQALREVGNLTEQQFIDLTAAISNYGVATENLRLYDQGVDALRGDRGALGGFLRPNKDRAGRENNDASREAERLANFGEQAAERIARINERFNEQPRLIDQAAQSTRELDRIIADLSERKPTNFQQMIADAEAAKDVIEDALVRPLRDLEQASERRQQINLLTLAGREEEAEVLQVMWGLERELGAAAWDHLGVVRDLVSEEREVTEEIKRRQALQSAYLDTTRAIRGELESLFSGDGFNVGKIARQLQSRVFVEQMFGDALRQIDREVQSGFDDQVDYLEQNSRRAQEELGRLAATVSEVTRSLADPNYTPNLPAGVAAANDNANSDVITVTGSRSGGSTLAGMSPQEYFDLVGRRMATPIIEALEAQIGQRLPAELSGALSGAIGGYLGAGPVGAVLGGLKGLFPDSELLSGAFGGAAQGSQIAGLFKSLGLGGSTTGAQIGGAIGSALPIPGGDIIGAVAGSMIGSLFKSAPYGTASFGSGNGFNVTAKGKGRADGASDLGNSFQAALDAIAEQLDAQLGEFAVSIGTFKDEFKVSTSGKSGKLKKGTDIQTFASAAEAQTAALMDAIADGAIKGITAGEQSYLARAKDIEKALQDVLDFRSVFDRLKAYKDPVGAALDELDDEFSRLRDLFGDMGASAAEYAQLEELYGIERAKAIKDATEQMTGTLKALLDELTIGDSGLSLRDRRANALTQYDALKGRVQAGDTTAFDAFTEASRALLDIERQMFGSQSGYFSRFFEVKGITETALSEQERLTNAAINRDSPLSGASEAQNTALIQTIDRTSNAQVNQLIAVNDNLARLGNLMAAQLGNGKKNKLSLAAGYTDNF